MIRYRTLLASAFILGFAVFPAGMSADGATGWQLPRFPDDSAAVYKLASSVTPPNGVEVLVLDEEDSEWFDSQGASVRTFYMVYKVLTQEGAEQWDSVGVSWEPWHETRPEIRARVINADGAVHPLDPKTISDATDSDDEHDVYNNRRSLRAPLPAIAIGSVVEEEETIIETKPIFEAGVVGKFYLGRSVPVQSTRLVLDAPSSLPLQYIVKLAPEMQPERKEQNGRVRITFDHGPIAAQESVDVNLMNLPSDVPGYPSVTFSTGRSWAAVASTYERVVAEQVATSDVTPIVNKLVAGKKSREEKATALLQYVDREVRYTGVEFDDAAIVPRPPSETLKRKYGDCKDKATLLLAMFGAAGIPAHVALLNAGTREDVSSDQPGMGLFDHAIVYAPGEPDYWIDVTNEYARLGQLPTSDQGRLALIARSSTVGLVRTPETGSGENLVVEKREFYLAEDGPARILETTEPHGALESTYRSMYQDTDNKDRKKDLTDYVKSQYLAERLDKIERSDPVDISKQFSLTLGVARGKRGTTDLSEAVAAIRLEGIFTRLPSDLQQRDQHKTNDKSQDPPKVRTADYQLPSAFATEWQYRIVPPLGFQPKPLPPSAKLPVGPAVLAQEYSTESGGVVRAAIRFEVPKRRLTAAEAKELREEVVKLRESQPILIYFQLAGQALLEAGKVRESFQSYRDLIAARPTEAVQHLRMAEALLAGGLGQAARDEARAAVRLEPGSALAQKTLASVLEYDLVGRKMRPGSDYAGAEAAFRAAEKLDPDDKTLPANLAILLEYNHRGERYGPGAKLKESIAGYQSLTADELADMGLKNNVPYPMIYAGEFAEARKYLETLNPQPTGLIVAAEAGLNGSAAGLAEASKRTANDTDRKQALKAAGEAMMRARKYSIAADLYEAGASGENAANTMGLAALLRKARPWEELRFEDSPKGFAMQFFLTTSSTGYTPESMTAICSRNAREVLKKTDPDETKKAMDSAKHVRTSLARSGFPSDIMLDVVMQAVEAAVEGDDKNGYRVTLRSSGSKDMILYIVKEDGAYKLLDSDKDPNSIGLEMLDRIAANNLAGARVLLDWVRENQHISGGDDPLSGLAFPRMWTKGQEADAAKMKVAAAAILVQTKPTAAQGVAILEPALAAAKGDPEKLNIQLALFGGYRNLREFSKWEALNTELRKQYPESKTLFNDKQFILQSQRRFKELDEFLDAWIKNHPDDTDAQRSPIRSAELQGDYRRTYDLGTKFVAAGKTNFWDYNNLAWWSLLVGNVTEADIATATKAAQMSQNNTSVLHTLGCLLAAAGKTVQAREVLIQAMDALGMYEPESDYWYAFGSLAEQYGENEVARTDYLRVQKPKSELDIPGSSYCLAQRRLAILAKEPNTARAHKN
jgi:transglutaminase-like putative cysteine protease/Flp pilus assembly protein TadD